jgi:NAD(P)-dependent dehydrogenase (short-subunit alcohol dehydrogenase family)
VTAVQGDASDLDDLERLYNTVKREKGSFDVLWASAGIGEPGVLGEITEEQFERTFSLNARGTLFTVQKGLPLINDHGSILMTGSNASLGPSPAGAFTREAKPSSTPGPASGSTSCATARSG